MAARIQFTPIDNVVVGERARKKLINIDSLAESIRTLGLLQPIVIDPTLTLIAGQRRLEACRKIGWGSIPCYVCDNLIDASACLQAEHDENVCREPLVPTEAAELYRRVKQQLEQERKTKASRNGTTEQHVDTEPEAAPEAPEPDKPRTRETAAKAAGYSHEQLRKANEVEAAAKANPELFGDLPNMMDEQNIDKAYKELRKRKEQESFKSQALNDQLGSPVPSHLRDLFGNTWLYRLKNDVAEWIKRLKAASAQSKIKDKALAYRAYLSGDQALQNWADAIASLETLAANLEAGTPFAVCPICHGKGKGCSAPVAGPGCGCRNSGWMPEWRHQEHKTGQSEAD